MGNLRKLIASLGVVAILSTLVVTTASAGTFGDVSADEWYASYVESLVDLGVVDSSNANFQPAKDLNRAEAVKLVVTAADLECDTPTEATFTDVASGAWYYEYVECAASHGVVSGYGNGKFGPNDKLTREQWAKIVVEAFGLPVVSGNPGFSDWSGVSTWAKDYVATAWSYNVVDGYADGTFGGGQNVNKAESAKMVSVAIEPGEPRELPVAVGDDDDDDDVAVGDDDDDDTGEEEEEEEEEVVAEGGSLTAELSDNSPEVSTLADGTAFNDILAVDFTAGAEGSELTGFKMKRSGLSSDSYIKVSVWDESGVRHGSVVTFSEGYAEVSFDTDPIVVAANSTETVMFKVNLDAALQTATLAISIDALEDVTTNGELTGSFPISSGIFGSVDGATSVAAATFDVNSLSTTTRTVDIGQAEYELTKFKIVETSSKEDITFTGLTVFNNGTAADGDLTNFQLKDQTGELIASAEDQVNKKIEFQFEGDYADGYTIPKGTTRYFSLYIDVTSGASRTAQVIVQNDYDITLEGATTGASILAIADTAGTDTTFPIGDRTTTQTGYNHITLNEGTLSIAKDNTSPSGDVTIGSSEVTLGVFKVEAQGEDIEMQKIAVDLSGTANSATAGSYSGGALNASSTTNYFDCAAASSCDLTGSVKVVTSTGKTLITITASTAALWNNTPVYADLSAYHTVKAGETETLSVVGNLQSNTSYIGSGESVIAGINKIYYYKKSSLKYADSGASSANSLSASTSTLTVSANSAYGAQNIVSGTSTVKLGSFIIKAGSAEDIRISGITYLINESVITTGNINASNIKFYKYVDGTDDIQLGTTQATLADNTNATLSISGLTIEKGEQIQIDVYADTSANLSTHTLTMTVGASGVSGTGITSQSSATGPTAALNLQVITGATTGTLTVVAANDNPVSDIFVAGSDGNPMLKMKLTASQHEDIYIKELTVYNDTNTDDAALATLSLYEGDTLKGTLSVQENTTDPGYVTWTFSGTNRPKVPKNGTSYLTVKGKIVSSQQGTVTNLTPKVALASMKAEGYSTVTPVIVAAFVDSVANVTADNTAVNDGAACLVNEPTTAPVAADTTIDYDGCVTNPTLVMPVGVIIEIGSEEMLVTGNTGSVLTVTRGYNGTTAADHANNDAIEYGPVDATAANKVIAMDGIELAGLIGGTACATNAVCTGVIGQIIQIGTEQMYVYNAWRSSVANNDLLYVVRAVNGTTIADAVAAANINSPTTPAKVAGNAMYVYNSKPTIAIATDSPTGGSAASTGLIIAKFVVSAANNSADTSENYLTLNNLDITFNRSSVTLANVKLYPANKDLDASYAVAPAFWASGSVARFAVSADTDWTGGGYDKVVENTSQTYIVRADVTNATNGSLLVKFSNLGTAGQASLGVGTAAGDVDWDDGTNTVYWVKQTASEVPLNSATLTFASATGTHDTTAPQVSALALTNGTSSGTANSLDSDVTCSTTLADYDDCDNATVTFNEAMDPTTINSSLLPGDTTGVSITSGTGFVNGNVSDVMTITNIATVAANFGADSTTGSRAQILVLNAAGTGLTIYNIDADADQTVAEPSACTGLTTTLKDLNGNYLSATCTDGTAGQF